MFDKVHMVVMLQNLMTSAALLLHQMIHQMSSAVSTRTIMMTPSTVFTTVYTVATAEINTLTV